MKTLSIVCALLLVSCAHAPTAVTDARAIVEAKAALFSAAVVEASASAWSDQKVDSLVALYTDDATLFPPGAPVIEGREAIRRYWSRTPDRRILKHQVTVERAEYSAALLYEYGTFTGTFETKGIAKESTAQYISVWRKEADGSWRKHLDSWW
jgi:ketosteroid isomerase-like protein